MSDTIGFVLAVVVVMTWAMWRVAIVQPETVTERVAVVVMELSNGEEMTTRQVAELTGLTRVGAWLLMMRLCRVLPIRYVGEHWGMLTGRN